MRRLYRGELPVATRRELRARQALCQDVPTARAAWKAFRQVGAASPVVDELRRMAGTRNRCLYCSDSRAADVDHYFPIAIDHSRAFAWPNLMWACPECNRRKAVKFPTAEGQPLVINPTRDDPWSHLVLDVGTGVLAPRFLEEGLDPFGDATLDVIVALNYEAVVEGRARAIRRLTAAAQLVLADGDSPDTRGTLAEQVREDEFGVAPWFAFWEGAGDEPFAILRTTHQQLWKRYLRMVLHQRLGTPLP
jgi:5-methylcytosine-specific restriction endonuclease McrA